MLVFVPLSSFCLARVYSDVHANCTFKLIKGKGAWHGLQIALESIGSSSSVTGLQPVLTAPHLAGAKTRTGAILDSCIQQRGMVSRGKHGHFKHLVGLPGDGVRS